MPDAHDHHDPGPRFESLAVFATVVRSRPILRVELAFLLFNTTELAAWIAILVYAYDRGGATAAGLVAFAQLAPAVVFAPLASALGDRIPRIRMLAIAYASYGLLTLGAAALLALDADPLVVYGAVVLGGLALTLVRPAHAAVMPTIARTPSELTAANVASGTVENVGVLVGSVFGGLLLSATGPAGVFAVAAFGLLVACLAVVGMRPALVPRRRPVELSLAAQAPADAVPGGTAATPPTEHRDTRAAEAALVVAPTGDPGVMSELLAGLRLVGRDPATRVVVLVLGVSMTLVGILDVLGVVLALDVLGAGDAAVGLISGALGAGGLLGAGVAISLVGRHRLLAPMLIAAVVTGLGLAVAAALPLLVVVLVGFLASGIGKSVFDVAGKTMLQRVAPEATLTRIFGVLEGVTMAALALGTLAAPVLVGLVGASGALLVSAALVPVTVLLFRGALATADASGVVHEEELGLIRAIPMFAPLRVTVLERLAQELDHLHVQAGADVIREGDPGDRYYLIGSGQCAVLIGGRAVNVIGPGEGFGEIALLNDVPRTATVRAVTDLHLYVLARAPFLEAITGQSRSRAAAQALVDEHLAADRRAVERLPG